MHLSCRLTRMLFEASESEGISRQLLVEGTSLDAAALSAPGNVTDWATLATLATRLSALLDDDRARVRDVGRRMARAPD
jgi:hypothetical protein